MHKFNRKFEKILSGHKKLISIIVILLVTIGMFLPYFFGYYTNGHESSSLISIINAYSTAFDTGNWFFPKILPLLAKDFGYGTGLFYSPFPYYLTTVIYKFVNCFFNFSIVDTLKIVQFLSMFLSGLFMYLFSKKLIKDDYLAVLSALIYMVFPFRLSELFVVDNLCECFTFMFLPLIFLGFYEILYNKNIKEFYLTFITGVTGLLLSHNIITLFTAVVCVLFVIFNYKRVFTKGNLKPFLIAFAFILGISSFYVVPIIEQFILNDVAVFGAGAMTTGNFVKSYALDLAKFVPYKANQSIDGLQFYITIPVVVLFLVSLFYLLKNREKNKKLYILFSFFAVLALIFSTTIIEWEKLPNFFLFIQYPWRLLIFSSFFMSLICPLCLRRVKNNYKRTILIGLIGFAIFCNSIFLNNFSRLENYNDSDIETNEYSATANDEYFPRNAKNNHDYYVHRDDEAKILSGKYDVSINYKKSPFIRFTISNYEDPGYVELPLLYYKGYTATYSNDPTKQLDVKESGNGFVIVKVNGNGTITINYTGTTASKISYYLTIISFFAFLVFMNRGEKNEKD